MAQKERENGRLLTENPNTGFFKFSRMSLVREAFLLGIPFAVTAGICSLGTSTEEPIAPFVPVNSGDFRTVDAAKTVIVGGVIDVVNDSLKPPASPTPISIGLPDGYPKHSPNLPPGDDYMVGRER